MEKRFIPVEGHDGLVRDKVSGAIISINNEEREKRNTIKELKKKEKERLSKLENEMSEIKDLLHKLIEKS
jgi:predicted transcriptional regulator